MQECDCSVSNYHSNYIICDRYKNFGSGVRQYPIKDILQYALEFAQAGSRDSGVSEVDVEMESPHCSMTRYNVLIFV